MGVIKKIYLHPTCDFGTLWHSICSKDIRQTNKAVIMNVFEYAAITEKNWELNLADMSGYERKYTFYADFGIAEFCEVYKDDPNAVKETFKRVKESWGKDIKAMTEVVMVLNHKIWAFYGNVDSKYLNCSEEWRVHFMEVYQSLYEECVAFIDKEFANDTDALSYYFEVTD